MPPTMTGVPASTRRAGVGRAKAGSPSASGAKGGHKASSGPASPDTALSRLQQPTRSRATASRGGAREESPEAKKARKAEERQATARDKEKRRREQLWQALENRSITRLQSVSESLTPPLPSRV